MAETRVTQRDIDALAKKLDDLEDVLSETERALLAAVFGLAGTALAEAASSQTEAAGPEFASGVRDFSTFTSTQVETTGASLPRLSDAFMSAFDARTAGNFRFSMPGQEVSTISVGGETITWSN